MFVQRLLATARRYRARSLDRCDPRTTEDPLTTCRSNLDFSSAAAHFLVGLLLASSYYLVFLALGTSGPLLGAVLGLLDGLFAGTALVNVLLPVVHPRMGSEFSSSRTSALLEPPGFLMLNYGRGTPIVSLVAHVSYGAIVGAFVRYGSR